MAVAIADEMNRVMKTNIRTEDILRLQSIEKLAEYLKGCAVQLKPFEENCKVHIQYVNLLNERQDRNIFAFPPLLGFGAAYNTLADFIKGYSFYSFDYIEDSGKLGKYVDAITQIQQKGPYILLGYSVGGKLAFEVARELLRCGFEIGGIIIVDTILGGMVKSPKETLASWMNGKHPEIEKQGLKHVLNYRLKGTKEVMKGLKGKMVGYLAYTSGKTICTGKLDVDIHIIKSPITGDKQIEKWSELAGRSFSKYEGFGRHGEMVEPDFAAGNAGIINEILKKLD